MFLVVNKFGTVKLIINCTISKPINPFDNIWSNITHSPQNVIDIHLPCKTIFPKYLCATCNLNQTSVKKTGHVYWKAIGCHCNILSRFIYI